MTPDINVLVAAFHRDHAHHRVARGWLEQTVVACERGQRLLLLPMVCAGFLRVVTHARVFSLPAPARDATAFIDALLTVPGCEWLHLGNEWPAFARLCAQRGLAGNLVQDAWIAMAVRGHGAHLITFDRDFGSLLEAHEFTLLRP